MPEQQLPRETIIPATSILEETGTALNSLKWQPQSLRRQKSAICCSKTKAQAVIDIWLSMSKMKGSQITVTSNEISSRHSRRSDEDGNANCKDQIVF
jgi:hypothetical protein